MKLRGSLLVAFALVLVAAPITPAQFGGPPVRLPGVPHTGPSVTNRAGSHGIFVTVDGAQVGKISMASGLRDGQPVQGLKLRAALVASTEYALVLDGVLIGTAISSSTGTLKMAFASPTRGRVPPLPEAAGTITSARVATLYQVSGQRVVATAQLSGNGDTKPR